MKRFLAVVLISVMMVGLVPTMAFAAGEEDYLPEEAPLQEDAGVVEEPETAALAGEAEEPPAADAAAAPQAEMQFADIGDVANLRATEENGSIKLSWDAVDGAAAYKVLRLSRESGTYEQIGELTAVPEFVDESAGRGVEYFYKIVPVSGAGEKAEPEDGKAIAFSLPPDAGANAEVLEATPNETVLAPITNLKVAQNYNSITLKWSKAEGANKYTVYRSASRDGKYKKIAQLGNVASYKDGGLPLNQGYYYKVRPYRDNTAGAYSAIVSGKTKLGKAESFAAARSGYNSIKLTWKKVAGASKYVIYRAAAENGKYTEIATVGKVAEYKDKKLSTNKTYYYKIRPYRGTNKGTLSKAVSATPTLAVVKNVKAARKSYNSIALTWSKASGATKYYVYRSEKEGGGYKLVAKLGNVAAYKDTKLSTNKTYYYKIRPYNGSAKGSLSKPASAVPTLSKIKNVKAASASYDSIKITWDKVAGANSYIVYRLDAATNQYVQVGKTGNTTSYTNTGLEFGVSYKYKVCPARGGAVGSYSGEVSAKTALNKTANLKAARNGLASIKITWDAVPGATRYIVTRATAKDGSYTQIAELGAGQASYTDRNLAQNKTYYYKAIPYRDAGQGPAPEAVQDNTYNYVTSVKAAATGSYGDIKVSWKKRNGVKKYHINRSTTKDGWYSTVAVVSGSVSSYKDKSLEPGNKYYYQVVPLWGTEDYGIAKTTATAKARASAQVEAFLNSARKQLGKPYVLGGKGPAVFDCSGLVYYCLNQAGKKIGYMTSGGWEASGYKTIANQKDLRPGDIVWTPGHVAIYAGGNMLLEASSSRGEVVYRYIWGFSKAKRVF